MTVTIEMKRTLSSRQTIVVKTLMPILMGGAVVILLLSLATRMREEPRGAQHVAFGLFALAWSAMAFISCGQMLRMKKVAVDNRFLYVSNYLQESVVPLAEIVRVAQSRRTRPTTITVYLQAPSRFGREITFIPKLEWGGAVGEHRVVGELRRLAGLPAG